MVLDTIHHPAAVGSGLMDGGKQASAAALVLHPNMHAPSHSFRAVSGGIPPLPPLLPPRRQKRYPLEMMGGCMGSWRVPPWAPPFRVLRAFSTIPSTGSPNFATPHWKWIRSEMRRAGGGTGYRVSINHSSAPMRREGRRRNSPLVINGSKRRDREGEKEHNTRALWVLAENPLRSHLRQRQHRHRVSPRCARLTANPRPRPLRLLGSHPGVPRV